MSACPACWAVSATMCRNTRRAERTAPGSTHGASGGGWPTDDAAAFVRAGIESWAPTHDVEVPVESPAEEVRRRIGRWSTVEDAGQGASRVRMQADDLSWPALALGIVGAEFTVISPPELGEPVDAWGRRFTRSTAELPSTAAGPAGT